jgi:hypothetical protein
MAEYAGTVGLARDIAWTGIPHEFGADIARPLTAAAGETSTAGSLDVAARPSEGESSASGATVLESAPVPVNRQGEPVDMRGYRAEQAARQAVAEALAGTPAPAPLSETHFREAA